MHNFFSNYLTEQRVQVVFKDRYAISLTNDDLTAGELKKSSYIRPNKLFTADSSIVIYKMAAVSEQVRIKVRSALQQLFDS